MNKNRLHFILKYYLPVLLWLLLIFLLSSMKGNSHPKELSVWFYLERKGAHVTEYLILTLLLIRLFLAKNFKKSTAFIASFSFAIVWALSDEFHQLFVFGREGKISDVLIDSIGIFTGILLAMVFCRKFYKK